MNLLTKFFKTAPALSAIAVVGSISFAPPAIAIEGDYRRFAVCKNLQASDSVRWHGIASGTEDDAFAVFEHSRSFHTRACFSSERDCRKWVERIWWEIPTMDELRTAYCKRV